MTKALHNKIYISIWCNVVLESIMCQMVYFLVTLVNTIQHTFPTFEIKLILRKKTNTKSIMFYIKLFIKNTLTNLFSTYGGSDPINKQILNKEKWQRQEFTCPP